MFLNQAPSFLLHAGFVLGVTTFHSLFKALDLEGTLVHFDLLFVLVL